METKQSSKTTVATFQKMGLPEAITHTLQEMQFNTPTPIQAKAIPLALKGKDILGSAQTGTGKTAAFGIPLAVHLLSDPEGSALVMTPTRELATQVISQIKLMLGKRSNIKSVLLIGGDSMGRQLSQLRRQPRVVVGTPGRINDHLQKGSLSLKKASFLVLDETDRMLDMGFKVQIEDVIKHMNPKRQTLLFSATLPANIVRIAEKYLKNPVKVNVNPSVESLAKLKRDILMVEKREKHSRLVNELKKRKGSVLIFLKTKRSTDKMATKLIDTGHSARALHGDLRQNKRNDVIEAFRNKKYRILVATDVAARGLDIPHIEHVINYDLPQCAEDYIHRIGRTARAGAKGAALNFVTPSDKEQWRAIEHFLKTGSKASTNGGRPSRSKSTRGRGSSQSFGKRGKNPSRNSSRRKSFR